MSSDNEFNTAQQTELTEPVQAEPEEAVQPEAEAEKKDKEKEKMTLYDWVQCLAGALVIGILVFMFVGRVIGVDGKSMYPTLHHTDKLVISDLFYEPRYGDIIVFQTATFGDDPLVKRVIATEGQTIDIDFTEGVVYVDGVALDEPYTNEPTYDQENFSGPLTVPEGCIFVMGDNRNHSTDSRSVRVGIVDKRCILGKVYMIIIPGNTESDPFDIGRFGSPYGTFNG